MTFLRDKFGSAPRHRYYPSRYCRLSFEECFETCLTDINPGGKNGKVLHPTQHRVLTVREQARAQGFPDNFTWDSTDQKPKAMIKQIGNAVAVPVGRALGKELLKVLIRQWEKDQCAAMRRPSKNDNTNHQDDVEFVDVDQQSRSRRYFDTLPFSEEEDLMDLD